jgi:hypothetical protein
MNKHIELKPCPFCGESVDIYLFDTDNFLVSKVRCDGCGAFAPAESWNDREKDMTGTGSNVNKHIELVKKWLDDPDSVTLQELKDNAYAADAAADSAADAAAAAYAADPAYAADAAECVKKYEELTGEFGEMK